MDKHLIWAISLILTVSIICGTLLWINHNSWTVRFEMDNNTKEAIESIEYPMVNINDGVDPHQGVFETDPCPSLYCCPNGIHCDMSRYGGNDAKGGLSE